MIRSFLLLFILACSVSLALAEDADLGNYGHRHYELHSKEIIRHLMDATGSKCCDGGMGGECRVTKIKALSQPSEETGSVMYDAWLDGQWCPITVKVHLDIALPDDVQAVVCAHKPITTMGRGGCPATFCAAASTGM